MSTHSLTRDAHVPRKVWSVLPITQTWSPHAHYVLNAAGGKQGAHGVGLQVQHKNMKEREHQPSTQATTAPTGRFIHKQRMVPGTPTNGAH
jgi:hypothetical protein